MAANVARLKQDMDAAKSTVSGAMDKIKSSAGMAMKALGAIGIGLSIGAIGAYFTNLVKSSIEAADRLGELAKATGTNVEFLSAMQGAVKTAGGDLEGFAKGINKLQQFMVAAAEGAEKNVNAFQKLGVSFQNTDGTMRKTEDTFLDMAQAFSEIADGPAKAALGVEIFSKQWQVMAVLVANGKDGLKEAMETARALGMVLDQETADAADRVADNMTLIGMAGQGLGNSIMKSLLPTLEGLTKMFLDSKKEGGGFANTLVTLVTGAFNAAASAGLVLWGVLKSVGIMIGATGALMAELFQGNWDAAMEIRKAAMADSAAAISDGWAKAKAVWDGTLPTLTDLERGLAKTSKAQRELTVENTKAADAAKKLQESFRKLFDDLETKLELDDLAIKLGRELTNSEKTQIDLLAKIAKETKGLDSAQKQVLIGLALTHVENLKNAESKKALTEATKAYAESVALAYEQVADALEKHQKENDQTEAALRAMVEGLKEEAKTLNMTEVERELYNLGLAKSKALLGADDDARRATIESLYAEAEARIRARAQVKEQASAWESLSGVTQNFFEDLFQNGTSAFGNLWSVIKKFFAQVAAQFATKFVMNAVFGGGSGGGSGGGIMSMISSLFSGGGADGGVTSSSPSFLSALPGAGGASSFLPSGLSAAMQPLMLPLMVAVGGAAISNLISGGREVFSGSNNVLGALFGGVVGGLINRLAGDQTGIKFDNSVQGVGNPESHWQQNAISRWDISGDTTPEQTQAFADKINAMDQFIADNLLTDETLEAVRARLQAVKNPDWWNLEDKDAIEKASKYFLQERYSIIFGEIDAEVAGMIQTFQGSADELIAFIDAAAQMVGPFQALQEAMPSLNLSLADFLDLTNEQRQAIAALADTFPLLMADAFGEVDRIMKEAGRGTIDIFRAQGDAMDQLARDFMDGKVTLEQFAEAGANMATAYAQAAAKIAEVQMSLDALFADTREAYNLGGMTPEEQYRYFQQQADALYGDLATATNPEDIEALTRRILDYMDKANSLLSNEERAALGGGYLDGIDRVEALANERLAAATSVAETIAGEIRTTMETAFDKWSEDQREIADMNRETANIDRTTVTTPRQVDINVDVNVPATVTYTETGG